MKLAYPNFKQRHVGKKATAKAIIRAVASSTAIETGQSVAQIERTLLGKRSKYRKLALAN